VEELEGAAEAMSVNRWSAGVRSCGLAGKRKSGDSGETPDRPWRRKKALKSEAQERGRLKEASKVRGANAVKRVAKP
jgi:hypothetical protein